MSWSALHKHRTAFGGDGDNARVPRPRDKNALDGKHDSSTVYDSIYNSIYDNSDVFPSSQRHDYSWRDKLKQMQHDRLAKRTKDSSAAPGKRPVVDSKVAATDLSLRQKKRRLLAMDDWTGAKALAAQKPPTLHFPQHDDKAPVWGWGADGVTGGSSAAALSPHRSNDKPTSSDASSMSSAKQYSQHSQHSQHRTSVVKKIDRPNHPWSGRHSLAASPSGGPISYAGSVYSPLAPATMDRTPETGPSSDNRRSGSLYGIGKPSCPLPVSTPALVGMRFPTYHQPAFHSSHLQRPGSRACGSPLSIMRTSSVLVNGHPDKDSNHDSMITTPSRRSTNEGLTVWSSSVLAESGVVPDACVEPNMSRLTTPIRPSTPSSAAPVSHHTPTNYSSSLGSSQCVGDGDSLEQDDEPLEETVPLNKELLEREATPEDFYELSRPCVVVCGNISETGRRRAAQTRSTPAGTEIHPSSKRPRRDADVALFAVSRVGFRAIPDCDDRDDPIEESDEADEGDESDAGYAKARQNEAEASQYLQQGHKYNREAGFEP